MPLFDDEYSEKENYFSIILMRYSKRLGCFVEGYKKITDDKWLENVLLSKGVDEKQVKKLIK